MNQALPALKLTLLLQTPPPTIPLRISTRNIKTASDYSSDPVTQTKETSPLDDPKNTDAGSSASENIDPC